MSTLSHFVLPSNTVAMYPDSFGGYSAMPEGAEAELNAFADEMDAIRFNEEHADDCARCERAAEVEAIRAELRASKRANRRDRKAMRSYRRTGEKSYLNKASEIYLNQLHRFCNRVRNVA